MIEFKKISIEDKDLFDDYFFRFKPVISEFTFTNLFVWGESKKIEYVIIDNHLLISFFVDNKRKFYQPVGHEPSKIISKIFDLYPDSSFERVDENLAKNLMDNPLYLVEYDGDNSDYIYDLLELRELKGGKYARERNFVNKCGKYNLSVIQLDSLNIPSHKELQIKWCRLKDCDSDIHLKNESRAVLLALDNFNILGLFGVCIMISDNIVGFAIGEKLNDDTFVEHFEKADPDYKGIYQCLLNKFVKNISANFKFLNREQDLGIIGLRKAKTAYHPLKLIKKYKVRRTQEK